MVTVMRLVVDHNQVSFRTELPTNSVDDLIRRLLGKLTHGPV